MQSSTGLLPRLTAGAVLPWPAGRIWRRHCGQKENSRTTISTESSLRSAGGDPDSSNGTNYGCSTTDTFGTNGEILVLPVIEQATATIWFTPPSPLRNSPRTSSGWTGLKLCDDLRVLWFRQDYRTFLMASSVSRRSVSLCCESLTLSRTGARKEIIWRARASCSGIPLERI